MDAPMRAKIVLATAVVAALGGATQAAGQGLPKGSEPVTLDPSTFTTRIDNPWWPMRPGSRWVYRETEHDGTRRRVMVTVTNRTKLIANGVRARVVRDVVTEGGQPVEKTADWYAQDKAGNIWYLGEHTVEFENGRPVSTEGSFEAGVDGAQPGVVMPARPRVGMRYRQEYYAGEAEDAAEILARRLQAQVPFGHFSGVLMTMDVNRLEPKVLEFKLYARGIGPVLALGVSGGAEREELVSHRRGRQPYGRCCS
jgi:hypothetical protein